MKFKPQKTFPDELEPTDVILKRLQIQDHERWQRRQYVAFPRKQHVHVNNWNLQITTSN